MKNVNIIKVNFKGGIIPPEMLFNILVAAGKSGIRYVRFGLRQQLLLDVEIEDISGLTAELDTLGIVYELNGDAFPNIASSFPAEEIFIIDTWLSESIYKEIFASFNHTPRLKVNICDANQSFTPLLTGNINWVAAPGEPNYWYLFIRFPRTNIIYEWKDIVPTRELAAMSLFIEETILAEKQLFYDNEEANGDDLYERVLSRSFGTRPAPAPLLLPEFKLPYYEGLNRYGEKYWLGIYRRDELYSVKFLKEVCQICVESNIENLCSTPWKTIIIKQIREEHRDDWNRMLDTYQINVRHAANELNFQVEDNNRIALALKQHLVKYLNDDDTRTFGVCIGIKTRRKTEVFSSILVKRKSLFRIGKWGFFHSYDILCAKDYNPNERTAFVFSRDNPKFVLAEQLRRAVLSYYHYEEPEVPAPAKEEPVPGAEAEA